MAKNQGLKAANRLGMLSYLSEATTEETEHSLRELLDCAAAFNQEVGVTGVLLYAHGQFAQMIEGPQLALDAVFGRIARSRRHRAITVLEQGPIDERLFGQWSMRWWLDEPQDVRARLSLDDDGLQVATLEQLHGARRLLAFAEREEERPTLIPEDADSEQGQFA